MAKYYSEELIEEIRSSNDIVDVISQYVILKRSGRNFFGLCPFHKEKSPSFSVSPDKQIFHCFGCGVGGNVIHFVSKIENLGFKDTLEMLANRVNIQLPELDGYDSDENAKLKSRLYELNQATATFYHENLYKPSSKEAQEYIKKRKLDNNTLKSFLIGYSGVFDELYTYLKSKGFSENEILASGLVNKNENGRFIDRFRRRLMFPIQDVRNRVIAFGGRVLDDSKPKYINSAENLVYSKGRHLFGLNLAKNSQKKNLIIVEGYMDCISLYQRGITNVVASLGTALTEAQGRLLRKHSEQVIIGYDADGAGQAATIRGMEILQIEGAKDPDEFVVKYGPERFNKYVENAISLIEFKIKILKKDLNLENANDKIKFLKEIAKLLSKVNSDLEKEIYLDKISKTYNISKDAVQAEINKLLYADSKGEKVLEKPFKSFAKKEEPKEAVSEIDKKREDMIIYLLITYPDKSFNRIKNTIRMEDIQSETNRKIIKKLYEELEKGDINNILDKFEETEEVNYLSGIMAQDFEIVDEQKAIDDIINIYTKKKLINKRNEILKKLEAPESTDKDEMKNLERELSNIIIELAKIK